MRDALLIISIVVTGLYVAPTIAYWVLEADFTRVKAFFVGVAWTLGFMRDK